MVHDRWPFSADKSTAELREKYYSLRKESFDGEQERKRLAQLNAQFHMSKQNERKELALIQEIEVIDESIQKSTQTNVSLIPPPSKLEAAAGSDRILSITLRSRRLDPQPNPGLGLGARMSAKVSELLTLMAIPPEPTPTETVCEAYDALRRDLLKLIAMRRQLKKLSAMIQSSTPMRLPQRRLAI